MKKNEMKMQELAAAKGQVQDVPVSMIVTSDFNPRKTFVGKDLELLAESIKQVGLISPIMLRPKGEVFQIVYGERRYRACQMLGHTTIRAIIEELSDEQAEDRAVIENLMREDVPVMEEARAYNMLIQKRGYDARTLADHFGHSMPYIYGRIKLANLIPEFAELFDNDVIKITVATELANYTPDIQAEAYNEHFSDEVAGKWQDWRKKAAKDVINMMQNNYSSKLGDFPELHAGCNGCVHNSGSAELFTEPANLVCYNRPCMVNKLAESLVGKVESLLEEYPHLSIESLYGEPKRAVEMLIEKGHEVKETDEDAYESDEPEEPKRKDFETEEDFNDACDAYLEELDNYRSEMDELLTDESNGKVYRRILLSRDNVRVAYCQTDDAPDNDEQEDEDLPDQTETATESQSDEAPQKEENPAISALSWIYRLNCPPFAGAK